MKYLWIGALLIALAGCNSHADQSIQKGTSVSFVATDSTAPIPGAMTQLLSGYLQMKSFFPEVTDTLKVKMYAEQMILWADSLSRLSGTIPAPLSDSMQIITMGISDELKGLLEEKDKQGLSLSFQLTGLQLYDLLRIMAYNGRKIYLFQSLAGGEGEASWLDITPVSSHPFRESGEQVKAVDSISVTDVILK